MTGRLSHANTRDRGTTGWRSLLWWSGKEAGLGRKSGSYKFEKRQKELKKQKKKQEKLDRRLNKGGNGDDEPQPTGWIGGTLGGDDETASDDEADDDSDSADDDTDA